MAAISLPVFLDSSGRVELLRYSRGLGWLILRRVTWKNQGVIPLEAVAGAFSLNPLKLPCSGLRHMCSPTCRGRVLSTLHSPMTLRSNDRNPVIFGVILRGYSLPIMCSVGCLDPDIVEVHLGQFRPSERAVLKPRKYFTR